jgi:hypothetical protein
MAVRKAIEWEGKSLSANPRIAEDARQARALSDSSTLQAECCELPYALISATWKKGGSRA